MNRILVKINGVDYSNKIVAPFKFADLLDERLDEAYFTLKNLKQNLPFRPLSLVEIDLICDGRQRVVGQKETLRTDVVQEYDSIKHTLTQKISKRYVVATDKANEFPVGSGLYTHDLYVIEETKILEGFICDSISFTNPLGHDYIGSSTEVVKLKKIESTYYLGYNAGWYASTKELNTDFILTYGEGDLNKAKVVIFRDNTETANIGEYVGEYLLMYPSKSTFGSLVNGNVILANYNNLQ